MGCHIMPPSSLFGSSQGMSDMLLLRPPPRELLERGPPASLAAALAGMRAKRIDSHEGALQIARELGLLPALE